MGFFQPLLLGVLWALAFVAIYFAWRFVWIRLRLRRGLRVLFRQLKWSANQAPKDKLVLDVGAGPNPHIRADVICDKFVYDDFHRGAEVARFRPLVAADASALPFKTGAFDIILSNQMIEHLEDPAGFFREAGRVAQQGRFTCPTAQAEHLYSYAGHLWTIEHQGDTLIFTAKPNQVIDPLVHEFFAKQVIANVYDLDRYLFDYEDILNIDYSWMGEPKIQVSGTPFTPPAPPSTTKDSTVTIKASGTEALRYQLKKLVLKTMHRMLSKHRQVDWEAILACPKCHGDVKVSPGKVHCPQCRLDYPMDGDVPIMLIDHAQPA